MTTGKSGAQQAEASNEARKLLDEALDRAKKVYKEAKKRTDEAHKEAVKEAGKLRDAITNEAMVVFGDFWK